MCTRCSYYGCLFSLSLSLSLRFCLSTPSRLYVILPFDGCSRHNETHGHGESNRMKKIYTPGLTFPLPCRERPNKTDQKTFQSYYARYKLRSPLRVQARDCGARRRLCAGRLLPDSATVLDSGATVEPLPYHWSRTEIRRLESCNASPRALSNLSFPRVAFRNLSLPREPLMISAELRITWV